MLNQDFTPHHSVFLKRQSQGERRGFGPSLMVLQNDVFMLNLAVFEREKSRRSFEQGTFASSVRSRKHHGLAGFNA